MELPFGAGRIFATLQTVEWQDASYNYLENMILYELNIGRWFRLQNLPSLPCALLPGETLTFDVVFNPTQAGEFDAQVNIDSNDADEPAVAVTLSGKGIIAHTVTFIEGDNGTITGDKVQIIRDGADATAVTAVPNIGYHFTSWSGDYAGSDNPLTITNVTAPKTITANFAVNNVQIATDIASLSVNEGLTNTFNVKLTAQPTANRTVAVTVYVGDSDMTVLSGSPLTFTTSNWETYQTVTLAAAEDADTASGSALIRCSSDGMTDKDIAATEADNDYALAVINDGNGTTVPAGTSFQTKGVAASINATSATGYHFVN
ncbi:MAG: hypothetical protein WC637_05840, partial [Victivallales bacterium]